MYLVALIIDLLGMQTNIETVLLDKGQCAVWPTAAADSDHDSWR